VSWTQPGRSSRNAARSARQQKQRTGWRAVAYAAALWPRRWLTGRRFAWLLCVLLSCSVIWLAASHLNAGLRAAHGQGVVGQWTAQDQDNGQWYGSFVSSAGTVTLPQVYYAGSLPAVQPGTTVPALDAGASDEVYPLTGSDKWIHDLIGVIVGALALIGLLARGFYVARRRRTMSAGYLIPAGTTSGYPAREPGGRLRGLRPAVARSRAGTIAVLAVSAGSRCLRRFGQSGR
jgi:hypothetical protein